MTRADSRKLLDVAREVRVVPTRGRLSGRKRLLFAMATGAVTAKALSAEASLLATVAGGSSIVATTSSMLSLALSAVTVGLITGTLVMSPGTEPVVRYQQTSVVSPKTTTTSQAIVEKKSLVTTEVAVANPGDSVEPVPVSKVTATVLPKRERPSLEDETQLLQSAQGAFRRGLNADALDLLSDYDRKFPSPHLGEEATALRVLVHCQMGRTGDAKRWARYFVDRYGTSALLNRLLTSCPQAFESTPNPSTE
jgi:hypothetical protein